MGSEKCKNSGNDLSRGKGAIDGPRKPRGALGHLPWGEAKRLLWLARANEVFSTPIQAISRHASIIYDEDMHNTMEKREKWRWCAVERLSALDHLVTGESEGHEEPLGNDGTTRHSREVVEMSGKPGKP
ncbi:hypothetical protein CRG98_027686 [Punica granatum]|uniref:Uncharacterized protein n=1 Tax=Punica granatum TaxID=22663 RepID=A0A2I0J7Q9_PUNGR|nr:hypothetical protein CRG98_027686 [Punica granatum]